MKTFRLSPSRLIPCAVVLASALSAHAVDLPEVLVTASPLTPGTIVLGAKDLAESPGDGLAEALQWSGAADVARKGPAQADLSLRASTFEDTGLLFDGFPIGDPQTGHFNLDLGLGTERLQAVEISPVPWGSRGLAGTVNLRPTGVEENGGALSTSVGSFHTVRTTLDASLAPVALWGGTAKSDGYREDTDSFSRRGGALADLKGLLDSRVIASYSNLRYGANDFYGSFPTFDEWEETQTIFTAWRGTWDGPLGRLEPGVAWRKHTDHFVLDRYNPGFYQNFHTTQTGDFDTRWSLGDWRGDCFSRGEWLQSSGLGARRRASAGASAKWGTRDASAGLEAVALGGGRFNLSPLLAGAIASGESFRLDASLSRAFRQASFTELYYTDPKNRGNAALSPESAWAFRLSPQWTKGRFSTAAEGFARLERDLIDWARSDAAQPWRSMNIGHATAAGGGVRFGWDARWARLQALYDYLSREANLGGLQSKYALDFPRHKVSLRASGDFRRFAWSLGCSRVLRTDRQRYTLLDAKVSYSLKHGSVYGSALNALDEDYEEVGGVPMPGRSVEGGVQVAF